MVIRAIIRLQHCATNTRRYFVPQQWERHGIAAGAVSYYLVEGPSWAYIRRMLAEDFEVRNHSGICTKTVQGYFSDIGIACPLLRLLKSNVVPERCRWVPSTHSKYEPVVLTHTEAKCRV